MAQGRRAPPCRMGRKRQEGGLQSRRDQEGSEGESDEVQVALLTLLMLPPLNGATRIHVTIGDPIAQVKSPAGVTQGFATRGADAIMIPLQVKPADIQEFFRL